VTFVTRRKSRQNQTRTNGLKEQCNNIQRFCEERKLREAYRLVRKVKANHQTCTALLYAAGTWTIKTDDEKRLLTFEMRCYRNGNRGSPPSTRNSS